MKWESLINVTYLGGRDLLATLQFGDTPTLKENLHITTGIKKYENCLINKVFNKKAQKILQNMS